ncbi:MAG: proline dehydrogenase family protein [Bacteroidota bacterium]
MNKIGLIGYPLSHSFSKKYFTKKFEKAGIDNYQYDLYPLNAIEELPSLIARNSELVGLNVTLPYKEVVIPFLDQIDESARFGAVNTINIKNGRLIGYNTDVFGFVNSLKPLLQDHHKKALILGTGGAAKAVKTGLHSLGIKSRYVSRKPRIGQFSYSDLDAFILKRHTIIVNTTPLGTFPSNTFPDIPYQLLTAEHLLYDLVYNPEKTVFLERGAAQNTAIKNGLEMLHLQAEKAWEIWTSDPKTIHIMSDKSTIKPKVDFSNTQIAFSSLSNAELKKKSWMFSVMNLPAIVNVGSRLGLLAFKLRLPVQPLIKTTLFDHFCGGRTLEECQPTIDRLWKHNVQSILDYGVEAKQSEKAYDETMVTTIKAIQFCKNNDSAPVVSTKITGLGRFELLEKAHKGDQLTPDEQAEYDRIITRIDNICQVAHDSGNTGVFIDAEESWIQKPMDDMADLMMERYNKEKVYVYNTYQLYRHDRLEFLKASHELARKKGYLLGAKLVRGAYLEKENARAERLGYLTPMQPDKASTDRDYNAALKYCIDNYETIALTAATHNEESCLKMVDLIEEKGLPKAHPHLNFCQLLGMSDHLSFNLAKAGYCVAKYVVYGPIRDVIPYLIRRAQENTAIAGGMSRELGFIKKEVKRRKL